MAFYSGAYKAVYNNLDLGLVEDGFTLTYRRSVENIVTDAGGETPVNAVYRGVTANLSFVLSEWGAPGAQAAYWPFLGDDGNATNFGEIGRIGTLDSTMAKTLVLTACNSANDPTTITFGAAILSPDFDVSQMFANRHRKIAMQMTLYPTLLASATTGLQCKELQLFSTTSPAP